MDGEQSSRSRQQLAQQAFQGDHIADLVALDYVAEDGDVDITLNEVDSISWFQPLSFRKAPLLKVVLEGSFELGYLGFCNESRVWRRYDFVVAQILGKRKGKDERLGGSPPQ